MFKKSLFFVVLAVILMSAGCAILGNDGSPISFFPTNYYGEGKGDSFLVFGVKPRVDEVAAHIGSKGFKVIRKYTIDEEKDAGHDVGVFVFRVTADDNIFVPISNQLLLDGTDICCEQAAKISKFIGEKEFPEASAE